MELALTTYSAYRGYSWSSVPAFVSTKTLNRLYRFLSNARGIFTDPSSVDIGFVSDGKYVAVFSIQSVEGWDAEKRASDYAAFAVFTVEDAAQIDFVDLINHDFFWTPSHHPSTTLDYKGNVSAKAPSAAKDALQSANTYLLKNPRAVGDLIAQFGHLSSRWVCMLKAENILSIECNSWALEKGAKS